MGGLANRVVERNVWMAGAAAPQVAGKVGRDCVKPSRELVAGIKPDAVLIDPHERFLSQVARFGFVLENAQQIIVKAFRMAFHEAVQRSIFARNQARHVLAILLVGSGVNAHLAFFLDIRLQ